MFFSLLKAFLVGGLICYAGQLLLNKTKLKPAQILVGFVVLGVVLGAFGIYEPVLKFAGAGASVPLTGFGFLLQQGVFNAVKNRGPMGILTGAFNVASAGISFIMFIGFFLSLITRPKKSKLK